MADDVLLDRLRRIAADEGLSLAEVIREGMELRAQRSRPAVSFVGTGRSGRKGHRTAELSSEVRFVPKSWR